MTGHALPWNPDDTDARRAAAKQAKAQDALLQKQSDLEAQQEAQKASLQSKINTSALAFLRSRFSVAGGSGNISAKNPTDSNASTETASSLFARITGQQ